MSEIRVNNITNRSETAGPSIAGIPVVNSDSYFVVPTGRTGQRYADDGENIVRDGLVLYLDAKYSYPSKTGIGTTTSGAAATAGSSLEGEPYIWYDISGYENHGQLTNGVGYNASNGGSLVFDGTNDYMQLTNKFNFGTSDFTISCWANFSTVSGDSNYRTILSSYVTAGGATADYIFGLFTTGVPKLQLYVAGVNVLGNTTLTTATWYNLVSTRVSGTVSLYINSALDNTPTSASGNLVETAIPRIGMVPSASQTGYFNGKIAQVSAYNRALTASEILQNYNATKSRYGY